MPRKLYYTTIILQHTEPHTVTEQYSCNFLFVCNGNVIYIVHFCSRKKDINMNPYRILVTDDEEDLCEILKFNLETEGYIVDTAHSAEEALALNLELYDLILLDVMMGEISGFTMASIIRKSDNLKHIPIIFITARDSENDMLTGFNIGGDDYISKPFSIREVQARIKALLRRTTPTTDKQPKDEIQYETLRLDLRSKKCYIGSEEKALTKREFEILRLLLEHRNQVFSREEILTQVWNDESYVLDRTIDVNITRLRKKITPYDSCIVTRLGYGYCFEA